MFPMVWNIWSNYKKNISQFMNTFMQGLYFQIPILAIRQDFAP